jgi:hypothetical protein
MTGVSREPLKAQPFHEDLLQDRMVPRARRHGKSHDMSNQGAFVCPHAP